LSFRLFLAKILAYFLLGLRYYKLVELPSFPSEVCVKTLKVAALSAILVLAAARAEALPILQLDIIGGHYDSATQTIVSDGPDFTLVALLTPQNSQSTASLLSDTYYISAAVSPNPGPGGGSLGDFSWNGTNYDVTDDMTYGTPPLDIDGGAKDPGDLQPHGVFPTYFREFGFQFSAANKTVQYNSQDDPGGLTPTTATTNVSYFATFTITTELIGNNVLHFDLYNTLLATCKKNQTCTGDIDAELNAPFSHDAQSNNTQQVPEPQSILLMSVGLLVAFGLFSLKSA
jgi:hypothetical protein